MSYTADQRMTNTIAAMKGYPTAVEENSVPLGEFTVGAGVIILTKKGEPIMSGPIGEIRQPIDPVMAKPNAPVSEYDKGALKVGDRWFAVSGYSFRHI